MKALKFTIDEHLLERLDADEEVCRDGRSAVIRRSIAAYLNARRRQRTAASYRRGYSGGVSEELVDRVGEGTWAED